MSFPIIPAIPYVIFLCILAILSMYRSIKDDALTLFFIGLSCILILFLYKGKISDWATYKGYVESASRIRSTYFEIGFDFLCFLAHYSIGFYLIPLVSVVLFIATIFTYRKTFSDFPNLFFFFAFSILCAYLPLLYGALRQSIAFSFLLAFFYCWTEKKKLTAILFIAAGCLFHNSTILILAIFVMYSLLAAIVKKKRVLIIVSTLGCVVIYFIFKKVLGNLFTIINYGENVVEESRGLKNVLLIAERLVFLMMSYSLLFNEDIGKKYRPFILASIAGSLFYITMAPIALNFAGRTMAFYRIMDIFILFIFTERIANELFLRKSGDLLVRNGVGFIPIFICAVYTVIKFYFTVVSTGIFF
jgi:hypothetical protein